LIPSSTGLLIFHLLVDLIGPILQYYEKCITRGAKKKNKRNIREVLMNNQTRKASKLNISKHIYGFPINMMPSQPTPFIFFPSSS
jgi:hypothetical protein